MRHRSDRQLLDADRSALRHASPTRARRASPPSRVRARALPLIEERDRIAASFARLGAWSVGLAMLALLLVSTARADEMPRPDPDLAPDEVVAIVVDALKANPELEDDAGIATVFSFASPGNRAATGPVERFTTMIKRGFSDMLGFVSSRFDRMEVAGDRAIQAVWLRQRDGREIGYLFQLGRQSGGEYDGMWMTDAVLPLGEGPKSGQSI